MTSANVLVVCLLAISGYEIMKKVDSLPVPKSSQSSVRMIIKKEGDVRERKLVVYTKSEDGKRYSVSKFLEPADVRGTVFLQITLDKNSQQYLYLSSLKKTRRIAGGQKRTSFMGSELTYEDLERKDPDNYEHKLLREDDHVYIVESTPKKGVETQYSKSIAYVRKTDFFVLKLELFDDKGNIIKVVENVPRQIEQYIIPVNTKVRNLQNKNETEMIVDDIKVDIPVDSRYFSESLLGTW